MYTKPLGDIIRRHGLAYHFYADDTQLYLSFKPGDDNQQHLNVMETCLTDIQKWMSSNLLKLNSDKTEVMIFSPKHKSKLTADLSVHIGGIDISPTTSVRNLGVILDTTLSMENQVKAVCKSAYAQLRSIGHIRRCLTMDASKKVVNSLVTTRLDYCNSLLYGIPSKLMYKLQKVQNTAARIITRTSKYSHITPVLKELHWLPVECRLKYKVLLHTHRALYGEAPLYITNMVKRYIPGRSLRSQNTTQLEVPRGRTVSYGDRCYTRAAPLLWNTLPSQLQNTNKLTTFKSLLKTYFFQQYYNC